MRIDIMTLFPETVGDMMNESILGRAQERDLIRIEAHQIRDFTTNRQNQVDDYPYGGGHGAVMQADPLYNCWCHIVDEVAAPVHTIYLSPAARCLTKPMPSGCLQITKILFWSAATTRGSISGSSTSV